jgi:two-component system NtrC family sensor kinase
MRNRLIIKLKEFQSKVAEQNEELRKQKKELEKWSKELEARVEAKTQELKRAEEHLIHAEKLAALGKIASGVAHEVNNPLASIAGYAEDMIERLKSKREFQESEIQEFVESLQIIEDQAYRLKDLTRKLLNFARQTELQLDETDINQLVDETISLMAIKHRSKLAISTKLSPSIPMLKTDRSKLQQIFMNLLDNAVDAIQRSGEIKVLTQHTNNDVKIIFKDTGMGIPIQIQNRIFDPFFTTKPVGKGTGLGLSICYGLVKKLKGSIEFESFPLKGSTFIVTLPLQGEDEINANPKTSADVA